VEGGDEVVARGVAGAIDVERADVSEMAQRPGAVIHQASGLLGEAVVGEALTQSSA
jgi:hypothetical protein